MLSFAVSAVVLVVQLLSNAGCTSAPEKKYVAITFDDAPVMRFYTHPSQWHRRLVVDSLANALDRYGAPATIFAVGELVQHPEGAELLRYWLDRGVELGNHSWSHRNFNELSYDEGTREIAATNEILLPFAQAYAKELRYFRFPFLAEGVTAAQKQAWLDYVERVGMKNARVTISNKDWEFDAAYTEAELAEDWPRRYEIGQAYMEHMRQSIAFWDSLGHDLAGRSVKHVLLLHVNRINRDYLGQILAELKAQGYTFIPLHEAYTDPIYDARDAWVSEDGTSFLENVKQTRLQEGGALSGE